MEVHVNMILNIYNIVIKIFIEGNRWRRKCKLSRMKNVNRSTSSKISVAALLRNSYLCFILYVITISNFDILYSSYRQGIGNSYVLVPIDFWGRPSEKAHCIKGDALYVSTRKFIRNLPPKFFLCDRHLFGKEYCLS